MEDYYRVLGVDRRSSADEIKRAYRSLARRYHPDVNPGDKQAETRFKRLSEAYEVLSDPAERENYDRFGDRRPTSRGPGPASAGFSDLFAELLRNSGRAAPAEPEADIYSTIEIGFEEAVRGLTTRVFVRRELACSSCHGAALGRGGRRVACALCRGSGQVRSRGIFRSEAKPCSACHGSGYGDARRCATCEGRGVRAQEETLTVKVPAGVDNGSKVRVPGRGNASPSGSVGDLYVVTRVRPHAFLSREGDNLFVKVPVTVSEAALGAKISVPTVDGPTTMKVPPGTQGGQRFRLRGKGVPSLRTGERGDEFVEVTVVVPRLEDERSREIMRELARLNPEDPRKSLLE